VQAVVPRLDASEAAEVWCRNEKTRRGLVALGFASGQVHTRRLAVALF